MITNVEALIAFAFAFLRQDVDDLAILTVRGLRCALR